MKPSPYAGFDPLSQSEAWEDRTKDLVLSRVHDVPPLRFFSPAEGRLLDAVVARLIPQDDRAPGDRVAITPWIDQTLAQDETDGFRKDGMPWDQEVWRQVLVGIDQTATARYGRAFVDLPAGAQDGVLAAVQQGDAKEEAWQVIAPAAAFDKVLQEVVAVYYAHPSAWAEIGWPGPASKRGYMRTGYGQRDPWQPQEKAPVSSVPLVQAATGDGSPSGSGGGTH